MKFNLEDFAATILRAKKAGLIHDPLPPPCKQNSGPVFAPQAWTCTCCNILFIRHNRATKVCPICKDAPKACEHCGTNFKQAFNKKAKTCGPPCARELMRSKKLKRN